MVKSMMKLAASITAALAAPTGAALADNTPAAGAELAEIVVTARQREEKITDVPPRPAAQAHICSM